MPPELEIHRLLVLSLSHLTPRAAKLLIQRTRESRSLGRGIHCDKFVYGFHLILAEDEPALAAPDAPLATNDGEPLAALAEQFAQARAETLALLSAIGPGSWQRPAIHPTGGRTTLRLLVQELVAGDIARTHQLAVLRSAWRAARPEDGA